MKFFLPALLAIALAAPQSSLAFKITNVSVSNAWIKDPQIEKLEIKFEVSESANVAAYIYDGRDVLVRTINSDTALQPGTQGYVWDMRDLNGDVVPAGDYRYVLKGVALHNSQNVTTYDLTELTGNKRVKARQVTVHEDTGEVNYVLPSASLVNINVGLKGGGPAMKSLINWLPRPAGIVTEQWSGMDESGLINLAKHPQRDISVIAYSFPDNTILVGKDISERRFIALKNAEAIKRESKQGKGLAHLKMAPTRQPVDTLTDVRLTLGLGEPFDKNEQGIPVVSGKVPFVLDVFEDDRKRLGRFRYEAVFYVDGLKVYENEIAYLPMTWHWDVDQVNPGKHYVTVNLIGYGTGFGIQTIDVEVK